MSRLAIIFGVLLIIAGGAGMVFGFVGLPAQFTNMISQATTPTAAELCNPGETLDEATGAEGYTPGVGYGRSVQYYCVNDAGARREVTGTFVQGMIGQMSNSIGSLIPSIFSNFTLQLVSSCLFVPGIILVVLGTIFSRRRLQGGNVVVRSYTIGSPVNRFQFPDDPNATVQPNNPSSSTLNHRLSQLEAARQAGLITDAEYEQARQAIINSIA